MHNLLKVEHITQQFGGLTALNDINIVVNEDEIVGVIGPNGAGKTTLFNVVTGVYTPTRGKVYINGTESTGRHPYQITKLGLARTFQNIRLFPRMTILENVMMGMHCRTKSNIFQILLNSKGRRKEDELVRAEAISLLKMMNLEQKKYDYPSSLPYGEQRRLEITRALATKPNVLLLDEPAAGMNEQETEDLLRTVNNLKQQKYTIILIEHDMKFVMNICDRIYVLDHGELIASGTPSEITSNQRVIEAYLGKGVEE